MSGLRISPDPLTRASIAIAWMIIANKPLYPLYLWWLVGNGIVASLGTLIAVPFFLAIPFLASRSPLAARLALPLIGAIDTLFETKLFGTGSGTALFLAPCIMLAALSFHAEEKWWQRGVTAFTFLAFIISRIYIGLPLHAWTDADLSTLLNLNAFAVASLMAFIAFRYAGVR
ncbi:hypothetical protein G6L83_30735 [Agrobacterium rhizogenes]|nr:hypothetical protein [Rhizobium rhizogenes]